MAYGIEKNTGNGRGHPMNETLPTLPPTPQYGTGPADPYKEREAWLSFVRPAADRGKLEKLRTHRARNKQEKQVAKTQQYYLSRKSYGAFHENYSLIDWSK